MDAVKTDLVRIRHGRRRKDGTRCRNVLFEASRHDSGVVEITNVGLTVVNDWTHVIAMFKAGRVEPVVMDIGETRYQVPCGCSRRPIATVKHGTVERAVRDALGRGDGVIWLTDVTG